MDETLRDYLASLIIGGLLLLQQGMIPVVDTKSTGAVPLNPCLVSGWPVNEGSGRTLHDISGNSNTATTFNTSPTWGSNAGFPGSSLSFGGTAGQAPATSTTLTNFNGTTPFSLAVWANVTSSSANEVILSSLTTGGTYIGWEITTETVPTNKLEFFLAHNTSNRIIVNGSTTIVSTGVHYLVATYDGSGVAAGVKLYVDGAAETVTVDQNNLSALTTANGTPASLGVRPADGNAFTGVAAAFAIYNCVLTPTNVSTYFARGVQVN